jgi:PleD family two-component response regulator
VARRAFHTSAGDVKITASAGAATTGQGYLDADALIQAADAALYVAKRSGRARLCTAPDAGEVRAGSAQVEAGTLKAPE